MTTVRSKLTRLALAGGAVAVVSACSTLGQLVSQPPLILVDNQAERAVAIGTPDPVTNLPRDKKFDAVYTAFIPGSITVHPGDTIFFRADSRGEPHTIALGRMIDKAGRQISELGLAPLLADLDKLPGLEGIPSVLPLQPEDGKPIRINRSAAEPCYLDTGAPPDSLTGGAPACPDRSRPSFNGRQSFYSSGWLRDRKIWKLKLSGDIKPGTYHALDLFHRAAQHMTIKVVPKKKGLPNIKDLADTTRIESVNQASRLKIPASVAWTAIDPKHLVAGVGAVGSGSFVASFPDETTQIAKGDTATWTIHGMHSITFKAPSDAKDGVLKHQDGKVVANQAAFQPINSGHVPAAAQGYRIASTTTINVDGGTYDGTGDKHSGILIGSVEAPTTYSLTFTKTGTYNYYCVVHPVMTGKISVVDKVKKP